MDGNDIHEEITVFRGVSPIQDMFARRGTYSLRRHSSSCREIAHNTLEFEPSDALFGHERRRRGCGCCRHPGHWLRVHRRASMTCITAVVTFTVVLLLIGAISYNLGSKLSASLERSLNVSSKSEKILVLRVNGDNDLYEVEEGESMESLTPLEAEPSHRRVPVEVLEDSRDALNDEWPAGAKLIADQLTRALRRYRRSLPRGDDSVGAPLDDIQIQLNKKFDEILQEISEYKTKLEVYQENLKKFATIPFYEFPKWDPKEEFAKIAIMQNRTLLAPVKQINVSNKTDVVFHSDASDNETKKATISANMSNYDFSSTKLAGEFEKTDGKHGVTVLKGIAEENVTVKSEIRGEIFTTALSSKVPTGSSEISSSGSNEFHKYGLTVHKVNSGVEFVTEPLRSETTEDTITSTLLNSDLASRVTDNAGNTGPRITEITEEALTTSARSAWTEKAVDNFENSDNDAVDSRQYLSVEDDNDISTTHRVLQDYSGFDTKSASSEDLDRMSSTMREPVTSRGTIPLVSDFVPTLPTSTFDDHPVSKDGSNINNGTESMVHILPMEMLFKNNATVSTTFNDILVGILSTTVQSSDEFSDFRHKGLKESDGIEAWQGSPTPMNTASSESYSRGIDLETYESSSAKAMENLVSKEVNSTEQDGQLYRTAEGVSFDSSTEDSSISSYSREVDFMTSSVNPLEMTTVDTENNNSFVSPPSTKTDDSGNSNFSRLANDDIAEIDADPRFVYSYPKRKQESNMHQKLPRNEADNYLASTTGINADDSVREIGKVDVVTSGGWSASGYDSTVDDLTLTSALGVSSTVGPNLSDLEERSGLKEEIFPRPEDAKRNTTAEQSKALLRNEVRGISLQEAKMKKNVADHRSKWDSRIVANSDFFKIPSGPDSSIGMGESFNPSQQISISPSAFPSPMLVPYQVCFYGNPSGGMPSIRSQPRTFDFHVPPFPGYYPLGLTPSTVAPSLGKPTQTVVNVYMNNYPAHVTAPAAPLHQTVPGMYAFASQQNMARFFNNQQQPLFCSRLQGPFFQFPTVTANTELGHARCSNCDDEGDILGVSHSGKYFHEEDTLDCPDKTTACKDNQLCIPSEQWCDGRIQCLDSSDELFCSCKDRVADSRQCDGYPDCPQGEDEIGCLECSAMEFSCGTPDRQTCVPLNKRCNGVADCVTGLDEEGCSILTSSPHNYSHPVSYAEGFLMRNWRGTWYPVCSEKGRQSWVEMACSDATGSDAGDIHVKPVDLHMDVKGPFLVHQEDGNFIIRPHCKGHVAIYVKCQAPRCGTRLFQNEQQMEEKEFVDRFRRLVEHRDAPSSSDRPFMSWWERVRENVGEQFGVKDVTARLMAVASAGDEESMGRNKRQGESRVVGGRQSAPHAWPWAIALYRDGLFHCGGVVLDTQWVLTAAHCVLHFENHYFEVRIGMLRRNSYSPMEQIRSVSHIIIHENYNPITMKNDLAVLRLSHPVRYSRWVRPICLPSWNEDNLRGHGLGPSPGSYCVAVGWGALKEHGRDPDQLREVEVPIMDRCKHREDIEGEEICAGLKMGGKDTCQGDSGGPLMCRDATNVGAWYVAGVVSHGEGCARPDEPGAYTRVSLYVNWLTQHTDGELPRITPLRSCPGFQCRSHPKMCLPAADRCNGLAECFDGEDEVNCSPFKSESYSIGYNEAVLKQDTIHVPTSREQIKLDQLIFSYTVAVNATSPFECLGVLQTIPGLRKCDGVQDCEDASDELDCSCRDRLIRERLHAICDGIVDCADASDEKHCYDCPQGYFNCRQSRQCVPINKKCDSTNDCLFREDESNCLMLTSTFSIEIKPSGVPKYETSGLLLRNIEGVWQTACYNDTYGPSRYSSKVCSELGLLGYEKFVMWNSTEILLDEDDNSDGFLSSNMKVKQKLDCAGLYVTCSKQTGDFKPTNKTKWDWEAVIRVEGQYACMGLLLTTDWLLASSHCLLSPDTSYITAELGRQMNPSVFIRISSIHPLNSAKIVLLRLERTVEERKHLRPIQLPYWKASIDLKSCHAIGMNSSVTLEKSRESCNNKNVCFTRKKRPVRGCSSAPWTGMVVCYSVEGWVPVSGFNEIGGECGFQSSSFTNVLDYVEDINNLMGASEASPPKLEAPKCDGMRCKGGLCIPLRNICNGWPDCPFGDDEEGVTCATKTRIYDCRRDELLCSDGACIPRTQFGDNAQQCLDGSDEPETKLCKDYLLVTAPARVCDGSRNCWDKSDEDPKVCGCENNGSIRCPKSDLCISKDMICDDENDCPGGEDEKSCITLQRTPKLPNVYMLMNISYGVEHSACNVTLSLTEADGLCKSFKHKQAVYVEMKLVKPTVTVLDPFTSVRLNNFTKIALRGDRPLVTLKRDHRSCSAAFLTCH